MSDEDAASSVPLQLPFAPILSRLMGIQQFHLLGHSRSLRLCSFCSAPRIATSGEFQFSEHAQRSHFVFSDNQIFRFDSEHAQSDGKSVNLDFWCENFQEVEISLLVLIKRSTASADKSTSWLEKTTQYCSDMKCFFHP